MSTVEPQCTSDPGSLYPIGTYATIRIDGQPNPGSSAWPVVERVGGGWQSGAHHYPDEAVSAVRVLPVLTTSPTGTDVDARPYVTCPRCGTRWTLTTDAPRHCPECPHETPARLPCHTSVRLEWNGVLLADLACKLTPHSGHEHLWGKRDTAEQKS